MFKNPTGGFLGLIFQKFHHSLFYSRISTKIRAAQG